MIVTVALPLTPSTVAVIVAAPTVTAVTAPLALTVATDVLLDAQVVGRPVIKFPDASRAVAVRVRTSPGNIFGAPGVTVTLDTGTFATVMTAVPDTPPAVAVIVALPVATAVTRPVADTVATA